MSTNKPEELQAMTAPKDEDPWAWNHFAPDDDDELPPAHRREREVEPTPPHWCELCRGHTGPASPCHADEPEERYGE